MCSWWAIMQMHGQQSGFILLKYFMQAKSAAMSDPPVSAAFLQGAYAALTSSTQVICLASGQSSATATEAIAANTPIRKAFIFCCLCKYYGIKLQDHTNTDCKSISNQKIMTQYGVYLYKKYKFSLYEDSQCQFLIVLKLKLIRSQIIAIIGVFISQYAQKENITIKIQTHLINFSHEQPQYHPPNSKSPSKRIISYGFCSSKGHFYPQAYNLGSQFSTKYLAYPSDHQSAQKQHKWIDSSYFLQSQSSTQQPLHPIFQASSQNARIIRTQQLDMAFVFVFNSKCSRRDHGSR